MKTQDFLRLSALSGLQVFLTFYSSIGLAQPKLSVKLMTPLASTRAKNVSGSSCKAFLGNSGPSLSIAQVDFNSSIGSSGSYQPIYLSQTYTNMRMGSFLRSSLSTTFTDRYIGAYQWQQNQITTPKNQKWPEDYKKAVSQLLNEWRKQDIDKNDIDSLEILEQTHGWRRTSFITFSIDGENFGGARLFDGLNNPAILDEYGFPKTDLLTHKKENQSEHIRLPIEKRFPSIRIDGSKLEIGLMTSRLEVDQSIQSIFYKISQLILEKYGSGEREKIITDQPAWIESKETGSKNISVHGTTMSIYRPEPHYNPNEKLYYYQFTADKERSFETLKDLQIYFVTNHKMTRFYQRMVPNVEVVSALNEKLNLMRISAIGFIDQFYFSAKNIDPQLNHRAADLDAFKKAEIKRRREEVLEKRRQRMYNEKVKEIVESSYPGEDPDLFNVHISGDYMTPGAPLHTSVMPKMGARRYMELFADDTPYFESDE